MKLTIKNAEMPIVVMTYKTTQLVYSEGALLETFFQREEYLQIGKQPRSATYFKWRATAR